MTEKEIAELEKMYNEASTGTADPDYVEMQIPGIGFVQATQRGLLLEGKSATPEEAHAIADWLNKRK